MAPVLFLIFNRPDHTARSFAAIRQARPARLYVSADGPRPDLAGEAEACARARAVATAVDWPCEVHTRFNDTNQGCRRAISGALGWFFECEEQGIVLEDDLVADPTFFAFAGELLERYRHDERVFSINGSNYGYVPTWPQSYGFSMFMNMSGWASWRRSHRLVDPEMTEWAQRRTGRIGVLYRALRRPIVRPEWERILWASYWYDRFNAVIDRRVDSWGYTWVYTALRSGMISVAPRVGMVHNIGWGPGATHTPDSEDPRASIAAEPMTFPLHHPARIATDIAYDRHAMDVWTRYREVSSTRVLIRRAAFDIAPSSAERLTSAMRSARAALHR